MFCHSVAQKLHCSCVYKFPKRSSVGLFCCQILSLTTSFHHYPASPSLHLLLPQPLLINLTLLASAQLPWWAGICSFFCEESRSISPGFGIADDKSSTRSVFWQHSPLPDHLSLFTVCCSVWGNPINRLTYSIIKNLLLSKCLQFVQLNWILDAKSFLQFWFIFLFISLPTQKTDKIIFVFTLFSSLPHFSPIILSVPLKQIFLIFSVPPLSPICSSF